MFGRKLPLGEGSQYNNEKEVFSYLLSGQAIYLFFVIIIDPIKLSNDIISLTSGVFFTFAFLIIYTNQKTLWQ